MKLIFLYGLPGSGKLTIGKELVKQLDDEYKLFHNQMTVDLVSQFFPFATPKWNFLNGEYRRLMFEACAEEGINLVTTYVYARDYDGDDRYIKNLIQLVDKYSGEILFVHLHCDLDTIFQRIQNEDRKKHRKVGDPEKLKDSMSKWDLLSPIDYVDNLIIDSGILTPQESAARIIEHYNLSQ
jgi:tRNA uridine 5-carbamoylmethylation protein Kti12